jgi:hypothetical protein
MNRPKPRLTYANVVSTVCLVLLLGGGAAFAAGRLAKNSVGPRQLKKNAVTTAKVKREAITAAKVKKGTLTGKQINASTLGTVPTAQTANVANSVAPAEAWHVIGAPGEPGFQNKWNNTGGASAETAAFYKDHEGIVHLRGLVKPGIETFIFQLPSGYRPPSGKTLAFPVYCEGGFCSLPQETTRVRVFGSSVNPEASGAVAAPNTTVSLNGIEFRAES